MLVLAVIGQSWLHAARAARAEGAETGVVPVERASVNASRIADITGIPRQTVRRKLAAMEARGWILRDARSAYRLASADGRAVARRDLSDVERRALRRVAGLFADLEALVAAH